MKQIFDWQDLRLFLAVARNGGLAGGVRETGLSAATLGRRMTSLEQDLEERFFERGARGYKLTPAGEALFDHALRMEVAAADISRWRQSLPARRRVRISGGGWTMRLLIDNIDRYWSEADPWIPEFISNYSRLDIARREIDIGVRNKRPDESWLAGRRVGAVDYAAYRSKNADTKSGLGWVGITGDNSLAPTARWTARNHGDSIAFTLSDPPLGLSIVRQGMAQMAMPCFVGDSFAELERASGLIEELRSELWLVMHQDGRHHPPVRAAIDALSKFLGRDSPRLSR